MPQTSRQDIIVIANQLCGVDVADGYQPSNDIEVAALADTGNSMTQAELLEEFVICLRETVVNASDAKTSMQIWKAMFPRSNLANFNQILTGALQIPQSVYGTLNPQENLQLYILIQLSSLACFLWNQQNDAAYRDKKILIQDLLYKIMQVGRILRMLIPLSNEEVKSYVLCNNTNSGVELSGIRAAEKRAVVCLGVEFALNILQKITVSLATGSVTIT